MEDFKNRFQELLRLYDQLIEKYETLINKEHPKVYYDTENGITKEYHKDTTKGIEEYAKYNLVRHKKRLNNFKELVTEPYEIGCLVDIFSKNPKLECNE